MESFRIHPVVGIARVGNSQEYLIAPETMAGDGVGGNTPSGGLPIRAGTESDVATSKDVRDANGALKRQAARFRIFWYAEEKAGTWPRGDGTEVTIGAKIGGRTVKDIVWSVHLANKKANCFVLTESGRQGIASYEDGHLPPMRNVSIDQPKAPQPPESERIALMNEPGRVSKLTIDPGPRVISGANTAPIAFDRATLARYFDSATGAVVPLPNYPKSFPADSFKRLDEPSGPIDTLGEVLTDGKGRLLVLGGYGKAVGWPIKGSAPQLDDDVNNDQWFDDSGDGPVNAEIVFDDGSRVSAQGAWVTATDPSFAPQILNVVSLWDDIYDSWVRNLGLAPDIFDAAKGGYQKSYKPSFDDQLKPIFSSAALQQWVVNLSERAISAHASLSGISAVDDPATTPLAGIKAIFRSPYDPAQQNNIALMPAHLGDAGEPFLTLRKTQYFFLERWNEGKGNYVAGSGPALGPGEFLDKATFVNCLGGRFSPGIDLTFVMRESAIYQQPWSDTGPFRVRSKSLAYSSANTPSRPLLTAGYVPRHVEADGLEPGDLGKFMALPWHTDYNSCATHPPSPNPPGNRTLFWSWPAQRPVAVYSEADVRWGSDDPPDALPTNDTPTTPTWNEGWQLGAQRWSVRGPGTDSPDAENWGRYQNRLDILGNWNKIGVILQATQVEPPAGKQRKSGKGKSAPPAMPANWYLEVKSQLVDTGRTPVVPFPNYGNQMDDNPATGLDPRELFYKLLNVEEFPAIRADARAYVDAWLAWSQAFSLDPKSPEDRRYFKYTEQAFQDRLEEIYQQLVDEAADFDPAASGQFTTYDQMCTYTIQWAPFNLIDGAWLRNVGNTGPMDDVQSLIYSVSMDERGDGVVSMNHCNIYRDLCHSIGYYPQPIESREFAYDPRFLDSAFTVPAFQLAISEFTESYYPEILGMTLMLEWEVVQLKQTRDSMIYTGLDPHFYVMHIGIDNAVNGHGQRARDAIMLYLQNMRVAGGDVAVQAAWRRIWNGYVAFSTIGTFGNDLLNLIAAPVDLRAQMIAMIEGKANFGSRNHQNHMVGPSRIDEWFSNPPMFLDALAEHGYIIPGDWNNSRMLQLMSFETGPMFRVFTDDEIQLWADYTNSLGQPKPEPSPPPSPARAMAAVIDQLRPVQRGVAGHVQNFMADENGLVHTIDWWFTQPTHSIMRALASPMNQLIKPGDPANSRFLMQLIAPTGPMGAAFGQPAKAPGSGSCRDVVHAWILAGCPMISDKPFTLRLGTPRDKRARHPTGKVLGMGNVH